MPDDVLDRARDAFERMAWGEAFSGFLAVDREEPLSLDDLERAARAAQMLMRESDGDQLWQRAVHESERRGDHDRAARNALFLGMWLMNRGDIAQAAGWLGRARRFVEEHGLDTATSGFLLIPVALQALFGGDPVTARPVFEEAGKIGARFEEPDLVALSHLGCGRSLIALGDAKVGIAELDEAMLFVTEGRLTPLIAGIIYCTVLEACHQLADLRRAGEWTDALTRWCDMQPELVPFRGQCLTHRAQLMRLRGDWNAAFDAVVDACARLLEPPPQLAIADALYEKGELLRLRGELDAAEEAYRDASQWGREPQPGLALLRLAQGRADAADAALRRVVAESHDAGERTQLLAAFVEVALAVDDTVAARAAAEEVGELAAEVGTPLLAATAATVAGAVALADGDARTAVVALRRAWTILCELTAPYHEARVRVLIGRACHELGDDDTAAMELDIARRMFTQLGAKVDLELLAPREAAPAPPDNAGLTGREAEVLELVAAGKTNRQIAEALFISEKTVARHVANIFTKLGVTSRAAATAYAFRHGLA